ncbi:MAG: hypothetical protein ACOYEV_13590 [Candidatus Nanopelagicales bacterium]
MSRGGGSRVPSGRTGWAGLALALGLVSGLAGCGIGGVTPPAGPATQVRLPDALQEYTGPTTITAPGTVIDAAEVSHPLVIDADDVEIRNSRITGGDGDDYIVVLQAGRSGLHLRNVEVMARPGEHPDRAIASLGTNMVLDTVHVHGAQRGIAVGSGTRVTNSVVDGLSNPSDNHASGVMSGGGVSGVVLESNLFSCDAQLCSAALSVYPQEQFGGPNRDWVIKHNQFEGGGYCVYLGYSPADGESPNTGIAFQDNVFRTRLYPDCGAYGPVGSWAAAAGNTWAGNTWDAPGQAKDGESVPAPGGE